MKKLILACAVFTGLIGFSFAQTTGTATEKAKGLQKQLALSNVQTARISAIYKESADKFEKIRKREHGDNAKITIAVKPLRTQTIGKIKAVLTPSQARKYDKLLKEPNNQGSGWGEGWSGSN